MKNSNFKVQKKSYNQSSFKIPYNRYKMLKLDKGHPQQFLTMKILIFLGFDKRCQKRHDILR